MTCAWYITKNTIIFKEMFKQCRFNHAFCCAVPNVLNEVVPVPYCSWKVALGIQISFSCLPSAMNVLYACENVKNWEQPLKS